MSKTILVVDDSKAMRLIVRRTLRQAGFGDFEVEEAANGLEALERIGKAPPALVISDWNMPEMNGIELLRELNARKVSVRFGFVTTEGTPDMRAMAGFHSVNRYSLSNATMPSLLLATTAVSSPCARRSSSACRSSRSFWATSAS